MDSTKRRRQQNPCQKHGLVFFMAKYSFAYVGLWVITSTADHNPQCWMWRRLPEPTRVFRKVEAGIKQFIQYQWTTFSEDNIQVYSDTEYYKRCKKSVIKKELQCQVGKR